MIMPILLSLNLFFSSAGIDFLRSFDKALIWLKNSTLCDMDIVTCNAFIQQCLKFRQYFAWRIYLNYVISFINFFLITTFISMLKREVEHGGK